MNNHDNTNRGAIWPNDNKTTDNHPDFKGSLDVDGKEFWVSAWKRSPDANPKSPSLKFSIQPKEAKTEQAKPDQPAPTTAPQDDGFDDIPF